MQLSPENHSMAGVRGPGEDTMRILAVCLKGAENVGCALQSVLEPAKHVDFVRESLADTELGSVRSKVEHCLARARPTLFLVCLAGRTCAQARFTFEAARRNDWGLPILAILESAEPGELDRLLGLGAVDFSLLPLRADELLPRLARWHRIASPSNEVIHLLNEQAGLEKFIGSSESFVEAIRRIPKLGRCDASVFITGETGTGKEMCARAIHQLGPRADHPFVPVNCGAIPSELVENELFGHEAGAYTGAGSATRGLVYEAEGGTLFLDEIDSLPQHVQVKFLRFLQDQEYRPLGGRKTTRADVRIIAASNANLEAAVRTGGFRPDLFYRLNVLPLKLPPLRERREDIVILARHFIAKYARGLSIPPKQFSRTAVEKLLLYGWPGNVRELENTIERAMVLSDSPWLTAEDICLPQIDGPTHEMSFKLLKARVVAEFEISYLRGVLSLNEGNISKAARAAKKNRRAFWQLMRKHNIVPASRPEIGPDSGPGVGQIPATDRTILS